MSRLPLVFISLLLHSYIGFSQRPNCGNSVDSLINTGKQVINSSPDSSFHIFNKASELSYQCKDSLGMVKSLTFIGLCHYYKNNYDLANANYFNALKLAERRAYIKDEGIICNNIGTLYFDLNEFEKSKGYLERSLKIMTRLEDSTWIGRIYGNLAGVYFMNDEHQRSIATLKESVKLGVLTNNRVIVAGALANLAMVHMTLNDDEAAFESYDHGISLLDHAGDRRGACITLQEKAKALAQHKKYPLATQTYAEVIKRAERISHKESLMKSYLGLYEIKEQLGQTSKALTYHKLYAQWKDSLLNEEKIKSIQELNQKYQTKRKEQEISFLTNEAALKDILVQKKQKERNYVLLVAILLLLIIVLVIVQLRQKQRLNHRLIDKNKVIKNALEDRETLIKEVHHRVKNNLQIVSSMLNIQAHSITEGKVKEAILESRKRVQSMSIVHEKLYQSDKIGSINIKEYIQYILDEVERFYEFEEELEVSIITDMKDCELSIDTIIPLGLIVTELVSNAYKHGFKGQKEGTINVRFYSKDTRYTLEVSDDGLGFESGSFEKSASFGIKLIKALSKGLSSVPVWENKNGTCVTLTFQP